ncbi:MAG: hypothetical protein ACOVO2_15635, partial [Emticicia sp.]|uniref:hypothetical protein n=1 Tax=Emticicia sp. TaxID=1930953 RepID=UPI003BA5498A
MSIILKIHHIVLFRLVIKELAGGFSLCFILFLSNLKNKSPSIFIEGLHYLSINCNLCFTKCSIKNSSVDTSETLVAP